MDNGGIAIDVSQDEMANRVVNFQVDVRVWGVRVSGVWWYSRTDAAHFDYTFICIVFP